MTTGRTTSDNRHMSDMEPFYEARIDALKNEIARLSVVTQNLTDALMNSERLLKKALERVNRYALKQPRLVKKSA